jgi:hypothetical protein
MRKRYPPYAKWLGSAFARLAGSAELGDLLSGALTGRDWRDREDRLCRAYQRTAALHNRLGLTEPLDTAVRPFFDRPQRVISAGRFADALLATVSDPLVRGLPPVGSADQFIDNVDVLTTTARRPAAYAVLGESRWPDG